MQTEKLIAKASIQIQKSPREVYNAIVDPTSMANYFIAKGSALMEAGQTVMWRFPEFDLEFPVRVLKSEKYSLIRFAWGEGNEESVVEISIEPFEQDTVVGVVEFEPDQNEAGVSWAIAQTEGWTYFLAGLKAFLDHNINLRKGAFAYRFVNKTEP